MASKTKKSLSNKASAEFSTLLDEEEWVIEIRTSIEQELEMDEEDINFPVSIFRIPPDLLSCKPEAYVPQLFAFGPYHHWRPQLYDMERYKLESARRTQARLNGLKFEDIVQDFVRRERKIRCHYHKYLDINAKTLAWMMAIDASFMLEFLNGYAQKQAAALEEQPAKTLSKRIEYERRKMGFNMIIKDIIMMENQIPLYLIRKLLNLIYSSKQLADEELSKMLIEFIKEVTPFKTMDHSLLFIDGVTRHSHLLAALYLFIVPKETSSEIDEIDEQNDGAEAKEEPDIGDPSQVKKVFNWLWKMLSSISGGPIAFFKKIILSGPIKFMVKLPWKAITSLPLFSIIKLPIEKFFSQLIPEKAKSGDEQNADMPPLAEEIAIPSVTELARAGVQFLPTNGDLKTIAFDTQTMTLYLPVISLDIITEVILRNLVAYEASVVTGPLVFTRYTEMMYGIIDTEEDVKILREKGIVENRLKSDAEAAEIWNGVSKSVRLSKVGYLDQVIRDVNKYYESRWRVKSMKLVKKYIFGSWQILTFLAAGLLLCMTCVQAFCSVYGCSSRLTNLTDVGTAQ